MKSPAWKGPGRSRAKDMWTRPSGISGGQVRTRVSAANGKPLEELADPGLYWPLCCSVGSPGRKWERWGWVWAEVEHAGF